MELLLNTVLAIALFVTDLQGSHGESERDYYSNNFDVLLNLYKIKPLEHSRIYREFSKMRLPTGKEEENNTNMDNVEDPDAKNPGVPIALQELFSTDDFPKTPPDNIKEPLKIPLQDDMTTEKENYYLPDDDKAEEFNDIELVTSPWIYQMKENKKAYETYYKHRTRIPTTVTFSTTPIFNSIGAKSLEEETNLNNIANVPEAESL